MQRAGGSWDLKGEAVRACCLNSQGMFGSRRPARRDAFAVQRRKQDKVEDRANQNGISQYAQLRLGALSAKLD